MWCHEESEGVDWDLLFAPHKTHLHPAPPARPCSPKAGREAVHNDALPWGAEGKKREVRVLTPPSLLPVSRFQTDPPVYRR